MAWPWNDKSKEKMKRGEQPKEKKRGSTMSRANRETQRWMARELREQQRGG